MIRTLLTLLLLLPSICDAAKIFESGFESATTISSLGTSYGQITGTDADTGDDWVTDLEVPPIVDGAAYEEVFGLSTHGGTFGTTDSAALVADPDDAGNQVIRFQNLTWQSGMSRAMIGYLHYGDSEPNLYTESTVKYRMYLGPFLSYLENNITRGIDWFMINELWFWNGSNEQEFRINLSINKAAGDGEEFYFHVLAQDYTAGVLGDAVWDADSTGNATYSMETDIAPPQEEWFTLEIYHKSGDSDNGVYKVWITPDGGSRTLIFDISDVTQDPNNSSYPAREHHVFKYYVDDTTVNDCITNGTPITIYYDDFEYYDSLPETVPSSNNIFRSSGGTVWTAADGSMWSQ